MKKVWIIPFFAACFCWPAAKATGQVPLLINYQGRLLQGTNLVNGSVGLALRLYNQAAGGTLLYEDSNVVAVADGLYATFLGDNTTAGTLTNAITSTNLHLEIVVNGGVLTPRERVASAAFALNASALGGQPAAAYAMVGHAHDAGDLTVGTLSDARLSSNVSLLGPDINSAEIADGTVSDADVVLNSFWLTSGNFGTVTGAHFLGTTDNQSMEIRANGQAAITITPIGVIVIAAWPFARISMDWLSVVPRK